MSSGLQGERTELAWLRTMLSSWMAGLIATKVSFPQGILALVAPVAVTVVTCVRRRRLKGVAPPALTARAAALTVGACAAVAAVAGLFIWLVGPSPAVCHSGQRKQAHTTLPWPERGTQSHESLNASTRCRPRPF